ncbi:MAG: Xylose isomerase domain protein barrel [Paenibacillus sp.]|nr:Xylose isomerase domain protein barrel [Paenibacillus sp.]
MILGKDTGIRIGTIIEGQDAVRAVARIAKHGFESFQISFWQTTGALDLAETAKRVREAIGDRDIRISALGVYGNPLTDSSGNEDTVASWERLIDHAHLFGTDIVSGFTGRIEGQSIDRSLPRFAQVFGELARRAEERGVRIAFENCDMGGSWETGDWNIAHNPAAWENMFHVLPFEHIGLEWEPSHQMVNLIEPLPQLRKWVNKVFHVHGKDATIAWDILREEGIHGPRPFCWHRTPGFGDSNWSDIITILRQAGYQGSIDIEGGHDPVYKDELEMTGQVHALQYLKRCRGGDYVPRD